MNNPPKVALVIGGSGMLAGLVHELSDTYDVVGVVGRDIARLQNLAHYAKNIHPVRADYMYPNELEKELSEFTQKYGTPSLMVAWIHTEAGETAPLTAAKFCGGDYYDVTGSSGRDANHISREREGEITKLGVRYHRVILGVVGDRWLTNEEISKGVYEAIQKNAPECLVGE